jgi:hypothetical protein
LSNVRATIISSLEERAFSMQSTLQVLDFVDRAKGYDLHDQLATADKLMEEINLLLKRMKSIVKPEGE